MLSSDPVTATKIYPTKISEIFSDVGQPNGIAPSWNNTEAVALLCLLDCLHPSGGYSQWQSRTVAQREGKCRAPRTNQNTYMVTRPEISRRTDRERNKWVDTEKLKATGDNPSRKDRWTPKKSFFGQYLLLYSAKRSPLSIILKIFFRFLFSSFPTLLLENTSLLETVNCDRALFSSCMPLFKSSTVWNIKPITSTPPNVIRIQMSIQNPLGCIVFLLFKFWCRTENERERERETEKEKREENRVE